VADFLLERGDELLQLAGVIREVFDIQKHVLRIAEEQIDCNTFYYFFYYPAKE
jgi:hypothetical protein